MSEREAEEPRRIKQWSDLPLVHVYGQFTYHDDAVIRGNRNGLTALRDAIDRALAGIDDAAEVFANDGEGYRIVVMRTSMVHQLGSPEYIMESEWRLQKRAAERDREYRLKRRQIESPEST